MTLSSFIDDFRSTMQGACQGDIVGAQQQRLDPERAFLATPAPNAIQWAIGREYLNSPTLIADYDKSGKEQPGYWRSYEVIRDVFQLRCPLCNRGRSPDCWGRSRAWLESEIMLEWSAADDDDKCPKCRLTRTELEEDGMLKCINQIHPVCGQRSGKSVTEAMIGSYVEHRLYTIALGHPGGLPGYLGLSLKDPFEMTFLASTEAQGTDTVWAKYRAFRRDSPWFQRLVPWIKGEEESQITPIGMERWEYSETNKKVVNEYPNLYLIINSLNSNSFGLRGRTRVFGGLDEIAFMLDGDSRMSADEIFRAVDNSLQTVRSRSKLHKRLPWLGLMCSVSSPRDRNDKAMRMLKEADNAKGMLAYHYATWEFNPYEPRENFDDRYAKDPVGTERDFGANPPLAAHPLILDIPRFRTMITDDSLKPTATFAYPEFHEGGSDYIGVDLLSAELRFDYPRYLAFDAGKNFDAFAGACAHGEILIDEDSGAQRLITVYDWIIRILPPDGTEVYYDKVYQLLAKLSKKQAVTRTEFDHWNATYLIQQIRKLGIRAEEVGMVGEDYRRFRADAYNGLIRTLPPDPDDLNERGDWITDPPLMCAESCALYEIESLEEDPITKKVNNPRKGMIRGWNSNDVAEVMIHVHKMVQEAGYTKKDDDRSRRAARKRSEGDAASFIASGGGGVYNTRRGGGTFRDWKKPPGGRGW